MLHAEKKEKLFNPLYTCPGFNTYFSSLTRSGGAQKYVDFIAAYQPINYIRKMDNKFIVYVQNLIVKPFHHKKESPLTHHKY